jgi:hypothetical protein
MTITDRRSGSASASTASSRLGGLPEGLGVKAPVKAATTANITLSGAQTIDGVSIVADDRVLVKDQTTATENGIYDCASGSWTRSPDFSTNGDVVEGTRVWVTDGTTNGQTEWVVTTADDITIDTTSIAFSNTAVAAVALPAEVSSLGVDTSTNAQTGTTYTILAGDDRKLITGTNAGAQAYTLPQATGDFAAGWNTIVESHGTGTITVTPTTSTVNGAASLALPTLTGAFFASDGTNYQALPIGYYTRADGDISASRIGLFSSSLGHETNITTSLSSNYRSPNVIINNYPTDHTGAIVSALAVTMLAPGSDVAGGSGDYAAVFSSQQASYLTTAEAGEHDGILANVFQGAASTGNAVQVALTKRADGSSVAGVQSQAIEYSSELVNGSGTGTGSIAIVHGHIGQLDASNARYGFGANMEAQVGAWDTAYLVDTYDLSAGTAGAAPSWQYAMRVRSARNSSNDTFRLTAAGGAAFGATITPLAADGSALGTSALPWGDVFLANGGVINWNAGDITVTGTTNVLAFAGASSGYTFDGQVNPTIDNGSNLGSTSNGWANVFLANGGAINWGANDITATGTSNVLAFAGASSGYTFDAQVAPAADGTIRLGSASLGWLGLNIASGGTINFANSNYLITHASGILNFSGVVSLGTTAPPSGRLYVTLNTSNVPNTGKMVQIVGVDGSAAGVAGLSVSTYGTAPPAIQFERCDGTAASRTAILSGDSVGQFSFGGYDGTNANQTGGLFNASATENWSNTAHGTAIDFYTTPNTTTSTALAFTIGQDKSIAAVGAATILNGTAIPAGGTASAGYKFSSTSNFGIFFGSGAPSLSAAQGSLYLRSDGGADSLLYTNSDGGTTWLAVDNV